MIHIYSVGYNGWLDHKIALWSLSNFVLSYEKITIHPRFRQLVLPLYLWGSFVFVVYPLETILKAFLPLFFINPTFIYSFNKLKVMAKVAIFTRWTMVTSLRSSVSLFYHDNTFTALKLLGC